ncbi:hypothetical protein JCM3774_005989 [Rhodotorula dairenensis]
MELLERALRELERGQLVHDDRYSTADLMAAIEINDPRTDSFLLAAHPKSTPTWDPDWTAYTAAEVLHIARRLFRLEATAHAGHPLLSTLWTCNLLRPRSLAALAHAQSPAARILNAILLATVKCTEIVWQQLERALVYEHEDVHLATNGLAFESLLHAALPQPQQPAQPVSTDQVLHLLDEALSLLPDDDHLDPDRTHSQLKAMLEFRISFLYVLALLTAPTRSSPPQLLAHIDHLAATVAALSPDSDSDSDESDCRSPMSGNGRPNTGRVDAAFAPAPSSLVPLLPTPQPPRPVRAQSLPEALCQTRHLCVDLTRLVHLWNRYLRGTTLGTLGTFEPWNELDEWATESARNASETIPYLRSLQQSLIVPSPTAPLFGSVREEADYSPLPEEEDSEDLLSLVASFVVEHSGPDDAAGAHLFPAVGRSLTILLGPGPTPGPGPVTPPPSSSSSPSSASHAARRVLTFLKHDVARDFLLRNSVHLSAQNRARQRRWTVKMLLPRGAMEVEGGPTTRLRTARRQGQIGTVDGELRPAWEQCWPHLVPLLSPKSSPSQSQEDHLPQSLVTTTTAATAAMPATQDPADLDLLRRLPDLVLRAVRVQSAVWALEAHLSGFEPSVGLFRLPPSSARRGVRGPRGADPDPDPDEDELQSQAWWVAERVAREILEREIGQGAKARREGQDGGRTQKPTRGEELVAIVNLSRSSRKLAQKRQRLRTSSSSVFSSPFLPDLAIPARDAARGRFRQQFEWLNVLRDDDDDVVAAVSGDLVSFEAYEATRHDTGDETELWEALAELARRGADGPPLSPTMRDLIAIAQQHLEAFEVAAAPDPAGRDGRYHSKVGAPPPLDGTGRVSATAAAITAAAAQQVPPPGGPLSWFALPRARE